MIMQVGDNHDNFEHIRSRNIGKVGIIGAGPAGMLAAIPCQPYAVSIQVFERIAERAALDHADYKDDYGYAIVSGGLEAIKLLSFDLYDALVSNGAVSGDALANVRFVEAGASSPAVKSDLAIITATRGYIRRTMRAHIEQFANITIEQATVDDVVPDGERARVVTKQSEIGFDLVIDASGRRSTSKQSRVFADKFYPKRKPKLTSYQPDIGIRSVILDSSELDVSDWLLLLGSAPPPDGRFGSQLMRLESQKLQVAVAKRQSGGLKNIDAEEILRASLPVLLADETIAAIKEKPLKGEGYRDAYKTRYPSDHPDMFLTIGDAQMSTNPIYGLGIASAAIAALELRKAIEQSLQAKNLKGLVPSYYAATRRAADLAWNFAQWTDYCYQASDDWFSSVQKMLSPIRSRIIRSCPMEWCSWIS